MPSIDDVRRSQAQQQSDASFPSSPAFVLAKGSRQGPAVRP